MAKDDRSAAALQIFRAEVADVCDQLADMIARLADGTAPRDAARAAMRLAHNIKGASGALGLTPIAELAHLLEDGLSLCARADRAAAPELVSALGASILIIQRLADKAPDGDSSRDPEAEKVREQLTALLPATGTLTLPELGASSTAGAASVAAPTSNPVSVHADAAEPVSDERADDQSFIRIPAARLDELAGYLDELLVVHGQAGTAARGVEQAIEALEVALGDHPNAEWDLPLRELRAVARRQRERHAALTRLVGDVNACVRRVRTVPLASLGSQWRRVVRECGQQLEKQVRLQLSVGDTELDKQVLDHLRDPFLHLLRNAVDHGIESPTERYALGKPAAGTISVDARTAGATVVLEVRDDGRGIDPDQVARAAVERGIISADEASRLGVHEKQALIFRDGLSTAADVTRISGRGVGLASVKEGVQQLGGSVSVTSAGYGQGSSFQLNVPLSVMAIRGLLVDIDHVTYVLPVDAVERALRVSAAQVRTVDGFPVLSTGDGEPISLVTLSGAVGAASRSGADEFYVVVLSQGGERVGLVASELLDEQDCVMRRLPWNIRRMEGLNGAVVLPNGSVALALDVGHILDSGRRPRAPLNGAKLSRAVGHERRAKILVVDDSLTSRTLERNMLAAAGYDVDVATDGVEAWARLHEQSYDVLVSDVQMPRLDGLELTRRVRSDPALRRMPVLLVTSQGSRQDIELGAAAGADEYLVKGRLERDKLIEAVQRQLVHEPGGGS